MQESFPAGYGDADARCFAHTADAHAEDFGTWGCSPWMSAILADGLDAYATERGIVVVTYPLALAPEEPPGGKTPAAPR